MPCLSLPGLRAHFWSYRVSVHVCVCVCVLGEGGGGGCGAFLKPKVGCGYHTKISNYQRYILRIDKFSYHILLTLHGRLKSWQWKLRHRSGPVTGWWWVISFSLLFHHLTWAGGIIIWCHGLFLCFFGPAPWAWWGKGCRVINVSVMIITCIGAGGYRSAITWGIKYKWF